MNIPGADLLSIAASVITMQDIEWSAFLTRSENATGDTISIFADPIMIMGSVQPVNKRLYQELGLNLARNYVTLWTSENVKPAARDRDGDKISFAGKLFQCESDQNWRELDGFTRLLCVEIPGD